MPRAVVDLKFLIRKVLVCFLLFLGMCAPLIGRPGAETAATIDDCRYADDTAAQAVWKPMAGTAGPAVVSVESRNALRLKCDFAGTKTERASWDREVKLDLASCRGIRFHLLCHDASPVSYFSIYFQSGEGWYHGTFFPESSTGWNLVTLDKTEMTIEGKPAGWGNVRTIRISAWRAKDANTEFYVSDLVKVGVLGGDAAVAIVRADSVAERRPEEKAGVEQFTSAVAEHLQALDIGCAVLSDLDVTAARLQRAKLVILPHNPSLPERVVEELSQYLANGGKLLAFYTLPEKLAAAIGVRTGQHVKASQPGYFSTLRFGEGELVGAPPLVNQKSWNIVEAHAVPGRSRVLAEWLDEKGKPNGHAAVVGSTNGIMMTHVLLADDAARKRQMLLAMVGSLVPELWRQAAEGAIAHAGIIGGFKTYDQALNEIRRSGSQNPRLTQALASVCELHDSAVGLNAAGKYADAMVRAAECNQQLREAFCMAQRPLPGEFRAFWCHSAYGVEGIDWDQAIRRLAENGFTAILPNMLWGGAAFYPSKVLPTPVSAVPRGDQIAQCLAACRKYGIQMHVWKVNWNLGGAAPREFIDKMRQQHRLQANASGKEEPWLCPSHPENQRLEVDSLLEVVRNYPVDGIHFDYIRYPDGDHCYCAGCQERFRRATGANIQNWPKDVLTEGPLRQKWLNWRRGNITTVVKAVSKKARALRPSIKISAAVFPNWVSARDAVGQDWKLWCEKGYVDFVCPMDYTPLNGSFDNMVSQQAQWAGRVPFYPGIGLSASSSHFGADKLVEQINITRRHHTGGFTIFNYGVSECKDILPLLGMGVTAKPQ